VGRAPAAAVSEDLLDVAIEAARAAAAVLVARFESAAGPQGVEAKSTPTDLVSAADREAERAVLEVLRRRRPDDGVLGEEGADIAGTNGLRWVVDPLDGTVNYLLGLPDWSVSVACEDRAGVVLHPLRDEAFTVVAGGPACVNGEVLRPSPRTDLATAVVATGFAYDAGVRARQAEIVARVIPRAADIRRVGSAALDLAWTAAGRLDAFYEHGGSAWDVAAGRMLCAAAGLEVRDLPARDGLPAGTLAAPAAFAGALHELVR
jgi:myo-inositol-1(or 4)-monophosphatase